MNVTRLHSAEYTYVDDDGEEMTVPALWTWMFVCTDHPLLNAHTSATLMDRDVQRLQPETLANLAEHYHKMCQMEMESLGCHHTVPDIELPT